MRAPTPVEGWVRDRLAVAGDAVATCGLAAGAHWATAPWLWLIAAGWALVTLLQVHVAVRARTLARRSFHSADR